MTQGKAEAAGLVSENTASANRKIQQFQRLVSLAKFDNFGINLLVFRSTAHPLVYLLPAFFLLQVLSITPNHFGGLRGGGSLRLVLGHTCPKLSFYPAIGQVEGLLVLTNDILPTVVSTLRAASTWV